MLAGEGLYSNAVSANARNQLARVPIRKYSVTVETSVCSSSLADRISGKRSPPWWRSPRPPRQLASDAEREDQGAFHRPDDATTSQR